MSSAIYRTQFTRVVVAGLIMSAASFVLVSPRISEARSMSEKREQQLAYIEQGESHIADHQDGLRRVIDSTMRARDAMIKDLSADPDLKDQQLFQRLASTHELTLTRVEPMKSSPVSTDLGSPERVAEIDRKAFRIECRGAYSDLISYIEDLQSSPCRMRVTSFRLVPIGVQEVRCTLNVSMVELTGYPDMLNSGLHTGMNSSEPSQEDEG